MKKNLLALLLAGCMVFGLAACGSADDTTNNAAKHTGKTRNSNYTKRRKEKNSSINW